MAQRVVFNGRLFTEPTSQARVIGGVNNAASPLSFGNICIIDTVTPPVGEEYGFGRGAMTGTVGNQFDDFVYEIDSPQTFRKAVKGGKLWDLAEYLWNPANGQQGASKVFYIRAADTVAGSKTLTMNDGKTWIFTTKEEGVVVNGVLSGSDLSKGYAITLETGVIDPTKVLFKFWRGTYKGQDANGFEYDAQTAAQAAQNPELVIKSPELTAATAAAEFIAWAAQDETFQEWFVFTGTAQSSGTGAIDTTAITGDVALLAGFQLVAGGTESYSSDAIDHVLSTISELDNSIFLALEDGANAAGTNNLKILSHIVNEADFRKHIIIGGGYGSTNFSAQSLTSAATLDSELAVVCHGGFTVPYALNLAIPVPKTAVYKAALVAGRLAGQEPQIPLTYKKLRVGTEVHQLNKTERVNALDGGVLHVKKHRVLGWVVNQGINSLQRNNYMINSDGTSPEISIERIKAQLSREIAQNAEIEFIGGNLYTASAKVIEEFVKSYLASKLVVIGRNDGLIVWFGNVKAIRTGTTWNITYDFQANSPINKVFSTGTIIDGKV